MPSPRRTRNPQENGDKPDSLAQARFLALLTTVQRDIDRRLATYLDRRIADATHLAPEVGLMVRALSDLCRRGGKRLRPALLVAGYRAVSPSKKLTLALEAGVALELLQAYFLIHDDWMDGDVTRRGGPTVHAFLSRRLRGEHRGAASAILAGDYAAALALEVLGQLSLREPFVKRSFAAFAEMQLAAVAGQQIDLVARATDVEAGYALKTGSYTVRGPLKLGAILAGGSARTLKTLEKVATPLGIGFQLRDDLLSAFGDPARTGKPLGNDLRAGKRTLLLIEALRRARGSERALLKRVVGNPKAKEGELRRALSVMDTCGARAAIEVRVADLRDQALNALGSGLSPEGTTLLTGAIRALTERRA
ncbi:MAG TPA: polyprenyl synthetase family protein [Polyangiaceae bacterium]|nr:polyprenyl synthetase family protein [Polyangiaceae bacterium]